MKVLAVLCLVTGALGSLEPAGYQLPATRYLPANRQNSESSGSFNDYRPLPSQKSPTARYLPPFNSEQDNSIQVVAREFVPPVNDRNTSVQYKSHSSFFSGSPSLFSPPSFPSPHSFSSLPSSSSSSFSSLPSSSSSFSSLASFSSPPSSSPPLSSSPPSSFSSLPSPSSPPPFASKPRQPSLSMLYSPPSSFLPLPPLHSSSSASYSPPSASHTLSSASPSYAFPSTSYGLPSMGFKKKASQYLPPNTKDYSSGRDYQALEESEPANYNFEYQVNDQYGNDFGHKENRQDEKSYGVYSVLLPDGRKQIVEYEADEEGFKPKISYEEIADEFKNARGHEEVGPY